MRKRILSSLLLCFFTFFVIGGCSRDGETVSDLPVYTITFVQENQEDVVRTVRKGKSLTDIPAPAAIVGYDVEWDVKDFSCVQGDMTVNAVKEAKIFVITYVVNDFATSKGVVLDETQQTVIYNSEYALFDLPRYTYEGVEYVLHAWLKDGKVFTSGVWQSLENITLTMSYFEPVDVPDDLGGYPG